MYVHMYVFMYSYRLCIYLYVYMYAAGNIYGRCASFFERRFT